MEYCFNRGLCEVIVGDIVCRLVHTATDIVFAKDVSFCIA